MSIISHFSQQLHVVIILHSVCLLQVKKMRLRTLKWPVGVTQLASVWCSPQAHWDCSRASRYQLSTLTESIPSLVMSAGSFASVILSFMALTAGVPELAQCACAGVRAPGPAWAARDTWLLTCFSNHILSCSSAAALGCPAIVLDLSRTAIITITSDCAPFPWFGQ